MTAGTVYEGNKSFVSNEKRNKEIYAMVPYYENVVILGDSLAESILDFRLLRKNNVVAKRGRCIDMIDDDMQIAIHLAPQVLFMEYGKNDIIHFQGNSSLFVQIYESRIKYLAYALPDTSIYVNSLIPMHPDLMEKAGGIEKFNEFNNALQEMCKSLNIGFIDNTNIISWRTSQFEYDGVHPKYPYYPKWLRNMASVAGLLDE